MSRAGKIVDSGIVSMWMLMANLLYKIQFFSFKGSLRPISYTQFPQNIGDMILDSPFRQKKMAGNFPVAISQGQ